MMRVYLKVKGHRKFLIPVPVPLFIFRMGLSGYVKNQIVKHCDEKSRKYLQAIDFDALFGSIGDIKKYRGLKLVEVTSSDGTEVTVIV